MAFVDDKIDDFLTCLALLQSLDDALVDLGGLLDISGNERLHDGNGSLFARANP